MATWHKNLILATTISAAVWTCNFYIEAESGDGTGTEPSTTGAVTGLVSDAGGAGVPGVSVHLVELAAGAEVKTPQTTDVQGRYLFEGVLSGTYRVYIDVPETFAADLGPTEHTVDVLPGATATVPTFELRVLVVGATVIGTVTDSRNPGTPLPDREVVLLKPDDGSEFRTTTDLEGTYAFLNLVAGDYTVTVTLWCGDAGQTGPGTLTLTSGETVVADLQVAARPSEMMLSCEVQPLLQRSCASSGCHGGSSPRLGLNLSTASKTHRTTVNVRSEQTSYYRVTPRKPQYDESYLVCKVVRSCDKRKGERMPEGCTGDSCLSTAQIDTIKQWIIAGAKKN